VVTDQSNRASRTSHAMMAYIVGEDACDVGGCVVCELLGKRLSPTGCRYALFNGDGVYVHVQYRMTSGCYNNVRWSHS